MHTVAQIIEELQINNLPHIPNGSFIITSKQRDAIESLLSQQAVVPPELLDYLVKSFSEAAPIEKGIKKIIQYGGSIFIHFNSGRQYRLTFQLYNNAVTLDTLAQTDTPEAMQAAAKEYADSRFAIPYDELNGGEKNSGGAILPAIWQGNRQTTNNQQRSLLKQLSETTTI